MDPFIAEIRIFAGNFAPSYWAFCDGESLPIVQNSALYALLSTIYGDVASYVELPDLRGRAPLHFGQSAGLSPRQIGQKFGAEEIALSMDEYPLHNHEWRVSADEATQCDPTNMVLGAGTSRQLPYCSSSVDTAHFADSSVEETGTGSAHNNMQPYLAIHFIIALDGLWPSRT